MHKERHSSPFDIVPVVLALSPNCDPTDAFGTLGYREQAPFLLFRTLRLVHEALVVVILIEYYLQEDFAGEIEGRRFK